jgi:hypothetical protein
VRAAKARSSRGQLLPRPLLLAALTVLMFLGACGGELQTPGEALRIFDESLPQAYVGEPYEEPVRAVGGLRPFTYQLEDGILPPGLELEAGVIRGIPVETGAFDFTITVSDANLSRTFQEYTVTVVERPPPLLSVIAPETEIRSPVTVRLQVENASELRAVSALLDWDEERFELVEDSVETTVNGAALLWKSEPGALQVDIAALGSAWNEELRLLQFTLAPREGPVMLEPRLQALFLDDRGGSHFQAAPGEALPTEDEADEEPLEDDVEDDVEEVP